MKVSFNLENNDFKDLENTYKSTYGKGFSMLKGFVVGKGTGKNNQGILEPVSIQQNKGRSGVAYDKSNLKIINNVKDNNKQKKRR